MENLAIERGAGGRPSVYSVALAERICDLIANTNMGLRGICRKLELCYSTVYKWTMPSSKTYRAAFRQMYLDAKEMQAAGLEEEIMELAADSSQDYLIMKGGLYAPNPTNVARCKLQITVKQWLLGRLAVQQKELPEERTRKRQWFVMDGYYVDLADGGSSYAAWQAAMHDRLKAAEQAKEAIEVKEAPEVPEELQDKSSDYTPVAPRDVVIQAEGPVWDADPEVVAERLAALREKYEDGPQATDNGVV